MSSRAGLALALALIFFGVGGASTVYIIGSHDRADDRAAVLSYESAVLAQVREMSVVAGSLRDIASAYVGGRLSKKAFVKTVTEYAAILAKVRTRIAIVRVPKPFGEGELLFAPVSAAYADAGRDYLMVARCSRPRCAAVKAADQAWSHSLALFRDAANLLQSTRERLGLGRSPNFPDPPR